MARIRSIKPTFAGDSKVARLSLQARLTFLLLLPEADDEGRMVGSSKRLAGLLFPNDAEIGPSRVEKWLRELENEAMVERYVVDGTQYLAITNFKKHQNPQHPTPSVLPPPPTYTPPDLPSCDSGSRNPPEALTNGSRKIPEPLTKSSSLSVEGVERELSSSSVGSREPHEPPCRPEPEDDDERSPLQEAVSQIVDRRIAASKAAGKVITNPGGYRTSALRAVDLELGDDIEALLRDGQTVSEIVDALQPRSSTQTSPHRDWQPPVNTEPTAPPPPDLRESLRSA